MRVRRMLTEILLDVTNSELRHVAEEVCERATSKQGVYVVAVLPLRWIVLNCATRATRALSSPTTNLSLSRDLCLLSHSQAKVKKICLYNVTIVGRKFR